MLAKIKSENFWGICYQLKQMMNQGLVIATYFLLHVHAHTHGHIYVPLENDLNYFLTCSPFYSICFLLPMLCQITMKIEGCKALISSGGYKAVSWYNFLLIFLLS